jgi:hypothetical protein
MNALSPFCSRMTQANGNSRALLHRATAPRHVFSRVKLIDAAAKATTFALKNRLAPVQISPGKMHTISHSCWSLVIHAS